MLEGNRFLPLTGIPILNSARSMVALAVWLPEPFLVAIVIEKSFTIGSPAPCGAGLALDSITVISNSFEYSLLTTTLGVSFTWRKPHSQRTRHAKGLGRHLRPRRPLLHASTAPPQSLAPSSKR